MNLPTLIFSAIKKNGAGISGYDITGLFEKKWKPFWSASHQQIYRDLSAARSKGLVTSVLVPQSGKPDKKLYSLTAQGEQYLEEVGAMVVPLNTTRDRFSAQLIAMDGDTSEKCELIRDHMLLCKARQTELGKLLTQAEDDGDEIQELIVEKQLQEIGATINWAEMALLRLGERKVS